jgi:hypothetical protein
LELDRTSSLQGDRCKIQFNMHANAGCNLSIEKNMLYDTSQEKDTKAVATLDPTTFFSGHDPIANDSSIPLNT